MQNTNTGIKNELRDLIKPDFSLSVARVMKKVSKLNMLNKDIDMQTLIEQLLAELEVSKSYLEEYLLKTKKTRFGNHTLSVLKPSRSSSTFQSISDLFSTNPLDNEIYNSVRCLSTDTKKRVVNIIRENPKCVNKKSPAFYQKSSNSFGVKSKAKTLGIRLTTTRNGKRIPKSIETIQRQIKNKLK
jgi:hypothetical protein